MKTSSLVMCSEGKITVPWEDMKIDIPLDFEDWKEVLIYRIVRDMKGEISELQEELKKVKVEQEKCIIYKFQSVPDEKAEEIIVKYLKSIKDVTKKITIFEISQNLRLSAEQVDKIMEKLEKANKVKFL